MRVFAARLLVTLALVTGALAWTVSSAGAVGSREGSVAVSGSSLLGSTPTSVSGEPDISTAPKSAIAPTAPIRHMSPAPWSDWVSLWWAVWTGRIVF